MTDLRVYPQLKIYHNRAVRPEQGLIAGTDGLSGAQLYAESQSNCGAAGGAAQANFASGAVFGDANFVTHHEFRKKTGAPLGVAIGISTIAIARTLTSLGAKATRYAGEPISTAVSALQAGCAVGFAVQYSAINAYAGGIYSGDHNFTGGHYLDIVGWDASTGTNLVDDWDALLDNRRASIKLGPVKVPFRMIRQAAGAFLLGGQPVGKDKGIFIVVEPPAGG